MFQRLAAGRSKLRLAGEPLAVGRVVMLKPVVTAFRIGQDSHVPSYLRPGHKPEGIRIGEEVDSKSIAGLPVAGSSPVPSASLEQGRCER